MTLLWLNKLAPAIAEAARPAAAQRALQLCTTRLATSDSNEDEPTNPTPPRSPLLDDARDPPHHPLPSRPSNPFPSPSLDALAARFSNAGRVQGNASMMQRLANLNSALRRPNAPGSSAPVRMQLVAEAITAPPPTDVHQRYKWLC